ncbi:Fur-regulated basic protein FbpA [Psychrobacillus sp.]|uniref:Fur-regulated basic protein FbpA n=1 Tax=Psychrobacillus sp. TaxID=1871623 RepID=UPI0028BDF1D0|nr:Fur-regulated basic protein FbpA [Psychrobacillus sp.]
MMNIKGYKLNEKREVIMEELMNRGVYKVNGKQLYQADLYELMKEYTTKKEN